MKIRNIILCLAVFCLLTEEHAYAGDRQRLCQSTGTCLSGQGKQQKPCRAVTQISVLSENEVADLKYMYEEEKLAGDLYSGFFGLWNWLPFHQISQSEVKHREALGKQLSLHKIDITSIEEKPAGVFSNSELQSLYNDLLASGRVSLVDALKVGVAVEQLDISDLKKAIAESSAPELKRVYQNLLQASTNHLNSFSRQLSLNGVPYSGKNMRFKNSTASAQRGQGICQK